MYMARPTVIDDQVLLKAARAAFLESGFSVPTAEIAKRAGISEGSIFKRYGTKAELFAAALELPKTLPWLSQIEDRFERDDAKAAMLEIGIVVLQFFRTQLPLMLKLHAHLSEIMKLHQDVPAPPIQALACLTAFFRRQTELGNIYSEHPDTSARMFLGAMMNYAFFELMFKDNATPPEAHVKNVIETLWRGISSEHKTK
jgi:AcrR family transcriptional regulator